MGLFAMNVIMQSNERDWVTREIKKFGLATIQAGMIPHITRRFT